VVAAIGTCSGAIYLGTKAPADATHAFFADLRAGNAAGAFARTSPEFQAAHPNFAGSLAAVPVLVQHTDATISSRNVNNFNAEMSGTLTTPAGAVPVQVSLVSGPQGWVITGVAVNGVPLP
jgi:hypothetical protein